MLNYEKIKEISAEKGILDTIVEKDYILDWILWGITQVSYLKNKLVFKGGTALHKMYFTDWRFSEDLDFTTITQVAYDKLQDAITELCKKVNEQSDIKLKQKEINPSGEKDSEWSFEIKIEYVGPRRQTAGNLPIILLHITNDELLMDKPIYKFAITPYEDLPANYFISTYSIEEILAEKIRTIFHQRCWPKDIYDTWRLLKELRHFIDREIVLDFYYRKSLYRKINPGIPPNIDQMFLDIKNQWKEGLQRQVGNPPDFGKVYPEVKHLLEKLFEDYNTIKEGGSTMLETNYLLRYKKGDLEIEVQGDKTFVEEKFKELFELKIGSAQKEEAVSSPIQSQTEVGRKISLAEFLKTKNLKSHGDKILVLGYYLEKVMNESSFNMSDIEKCYVQARLPKTTNFRPYISQLIHDGYIMDAEEKKENKKAWILTDTGLKYVESLTFENLTQ